MQHIPLAFIRLQDVAPGLTDDKGCFDQTDVGSRSDHLLLMEEGNGTMLDPQPPIADCLFEKVVRDFDEVVFDADAPGQAEIGVSSHKYVKGIFVSRRTGTTPPDGTCGRIARIKERSPSSETSRRSPA